MSDSNKKRAGKIIAEAKERLKQCQDAESEMRKKCLDDLEFLAASPDEPEGQWGQAAVRDRAATDRPVLVINRLDQFVQHISNAQRQNRVSARCFPVDDKGDLETAEVRQGIIRHIEYNSKGTLAYDTAAFYAVAMGFGYWRQITEYTDPQSFDLDLKLERILNPFQCYLGPHTLPDGSDAEFGFIYSDLTKEEFESEYPRAQAIDFEPADTEYGWVTQENVRIVEYYTTEWKDDTLVRLPDGTTALLSEIQDKIEEFDEAKLAAIPEEDKRETRIPTVKWYKLNAQEILDETEWPIPKLPIVKVTGNELSVNGKLILKGIVRNLKDAQRQLNKIVSDEAEAHDSSKGQVFVAEGQMEGHEEEFRNLNRQQVLSYKPTDVKGQIVPPPGRLQPNLTIAALAQARMMAAEDLKALVGIFDAALGNRSNETSGRGILARQQQSETANYHFPDNLLLSITHSTKMLVDLMPHIYDGARVVRIVGEDDSQKVVKINQDFGPEWRKQTGQKRRFDFSVGKYDVVCTAGPSFQTKRQEASEQLVQLAKVDPGLMGTSADIVYKAIDVPYAQEIAARRKKALPAELQDQEGQPEIPPVVQQQMAQDAQLIETLTKELNAKNDLIERDTLKLESQERIVQAELDVKRLEIQARMMEAQAKLDSQEAIALLKAEIEGIKAQMQVDSAQLAAETGAAARTM